MDDFEELQKQLRYKRLGYINEDRHSDSIVGVADSVIPGELLPRIWRYGSREDFLKRYESLGPVLWAKTANYHLLMVNGFYILRVWTAQKTTKTCLVDLCETVASTLFAQGWTVVDIPSGSLVKCRPLKRRTKVSSPDEMVRLLSIVRSIYGLENL